jgi:hypothetical protein
MPGSQGASVELTTSLRLWAETTAGVTRQNETDRNRVYCNTGKGTRKRQEIKTPFLPPAHGYVQSTKLENSHVQWTRNGVQSTSALESHYNWIRFRGSPHDGVGVLAKGTILLTCHDTPSRDVTSRNGFIASGLLRPGHFVIALAVPTDFSPTRPTRSLVNPFSPRNR